MSATAQFDTRLRAIAERSIGAAGKVLTFEVRAKTPDPTSGATVLGSPTSIEWKGLPPARYESRYVDGALIQAADVHTTISAVDIAFTPENGQKVSFDATDWRIVAVRPRYAGEQIWGYTLQLRR